MYNKITFFAPKERLLKSYAEYRGNVDQQVNNSVRVRQDGERHFREDDRGHVLYLQRLDGIYGLRERYPQTVGR